jgi:hypothetical protein
MLSLHQAAKAFEAAGAIAVSRVLHDPAVEQGRPVGEQPDRGASQDVAAEQASVFLVSMRGLKAHAAFSILVELENVIADLERVDVYLGVQSIHARGQNDLRSRLSAAAERRPVLRALRRYSWEIRSSLQRHRAVPPADRRPTHDIVFAVLANPWEVQALLALHGWREKARFASCLLTEIWDRDVEALRALRDIYARFDVIFTWHYGFVSTIEKITGVKTYYIPPTVDALKFCPFPQQPPRTIGVINFGRRSPLTHSALLEWSKATGDFYVYDTFRDPQVIDYEQHRDYFISQLQRSRYCVANLARFDCPDLRGDHEEISARFVEGVAAGSILIGQMPDTPARSQWFDWPDAVIDAPSDCAEIGELIASLDAQPMRTAAIRRRNVMAALERFDCLHLWAQVRALAGLPPSARLLERRAQLAALHDLVAATGGEADGQANDRLAPGDLRAAQ